MKVPFPSAVSSEKRFFYGWVIVIASVMIIAVIFGIRYSYGVFFKALGTNFGWTRAATSAVFSAYMILLPIFAVLGGWVFDRYGARKVMALSGLITGLSLILTSQVDAIWELYLTYSLLHALGTGATYTILMAIGSRWFEEKKGLALGIIGSGAGLGTMIIAPAANYFISQYDWRASFLILGLAAWIFIIIPALFLKEPSATRMTAERANDGREISSIKESSSKEQKIDFTLLHAVRTKEFYLLFLVWFCYAFVLHLVITHVVPRATDVGISSGSAATIISLISGSSIIGRLMMGRVSDLLGRRGTSIICALLQALALFYLIWADKIWMFYIFAVVYGFGYGGLDPPIVALVSDIFGFSRLGTIIGALVIGWGIGAAVGPLLTGYIFDVTGEYSLGFLSGTLVMLLTVVFIYLLNPSKRSNRED